MLLHGIGSSKRSWLPILDRLARTRRVIAVDLPGFGETPRLAEGLPTAMRFAEQLPEGVAHLGIEAPFDIAGFSLGGWISLEAAKQGSARSVVALTPAGLWARQPRWSHFVLESAHQPGRPPIRRPDKGPGQPPRSGGADVFVLLATLADERRLCP